MYQPLLQADIENKAHSSSHIDKTFLWKAAAGLPGLPLHFLSSFGVIDITDSDAITYAAAGTGLVLMNFSGWNFFRETYYTLKNFRKNPVLGMETLITLSSYSAYAYAALLIFDAELEEQRSLIPCLLAAPLITLMAVNTSLFIDDFIKNKIKRTEKSVRVELQQRLPEKVKLDDGSEISYAEIKSGMTLVVEGHQVIPADGIIIHGTANVEESLFTGHNDPRFVEKGEVYAGTKLVSSDQIKILVSQNAGGSRLELMLATLQHPKADAKKIDDAINRVTNWFVPGVIAIAAATFGGWWGLRNDTHLAALSLINVFCAACPCALSLATPLVVSAARHKAFQDGNLIHNPNVLAKLPSVKTIAFDKNGTLTTLEVKEVFIKNIGFEDKQILQIAYSLQKAADSRHPIALAIRQFTLEDGVTTELMVALEEQKDKRGLAGKIGQFRYLIGNVEFLETCGITGLEKPDGDYCLLVQDKTRIATFKFKSVLRPEAKSVLEKLKDRGYELAILSGSSSFDDCQEIQTLGCSPIRGNLSPEQKKLAINELLAPVLYVGDAFNDGLAAQAAFTAIAIGLHTRLTEYADATIPPDLNKLLDLIKLSESTMRIIYQNIGLSVFYNTIMVSLAAVVFPASDIEMSPAIFGLAMALSSVVVVLSSARAARDIRADDAYADIEEQEISVPNQHKFIITNATTCCSANKIRPLLAKSTSISNLNITPPTNEKCTVTFSSSMDATAARDHVRELLIGSGFELESTLNPTNLFASTSVAIPVDASNSCAPK